MIGSVGAVLTILISYLTQMLLNLSPSPRRAMADVAGYVSTVSISPQFHQLTNIKINPDPALHPAQIIQ